MCRVPLEDVDGLQLLCTIIRAPSAPWHERDTTTVPHSEQSVADLVNSLSGTPSQVVSASARLVEAIAHDPDAAHGIATAGGLRLYTAVVIYGCYIRLLL